MKTLLFLLFSLPAFANSIPITTFQLSGVGSGLSGTQFWASDPSKTLTYTLNATFGNSGYFSIQEGNTHLFASLSSFSLANGVFSGTFSGDEIVKLGPQNWVYWLITGNLSQTVNFSAPTGTGIVSITSSTFEGKYPVAPEPGTWIMVGIGLLLIGRHTSAGYRLKRCG